MPRCRLFNELMSSISDALFDIPYESAEAETLCLHVDAMQLGQQGIYLLVAYYGEDS